MEANLQNSEQRTRNGVRLSGKGPYLCKVRDLATGIVLAHTMGDNMNAELVTSSIRKARRRWNLPEGCIHRSDLGSQYTAGVTVKLLRELSFQQSFSRRGKPGDNAWSEGFFSILKKEAVHWQHCQTRAEALQAIFAYIQCFYNTRRIQKRLGYLSCKWHNKRERFRQIKMDNF